ncbi:MAG TPA: GNAT family N-acetyltransferase [Ktedonobacteraceae bacterium]|jgi:GNAT superfamily N-acetyltransferase|nr:GNAT family N-acetyltransferase [Ktedonobacteraceae bacterium]
MPHIEVRPARPEDRDAVLTFCANTWEWGDYIEYVWDEWLHNPDGLLLVATVDGRPAGITHMQMLTKTDAWLEGLRVDPEYRHQGLAKALDEAALVEAMRRGAAYVRLAIDSRNTRSIEITERGHMHRIGAVALYLAPPLASVMERRAVQERAQLATPADLDDIINYLNVSSIFPVVGGVYYVGWKAYPITAALLEAKIAAQQIYLLRRWDRLDGLAIAEPRTERDEPRLSLGYIDGPTVESISLLAYDLRRRLTEMGLAGVRAYAPDMVMVRDAFTGIEYEWDGSVFYTYERGLT